MASEYTGPGKPACAILTQNVEISPRGWARDSDLGDRLPVGVYAALAGDGLGAAHLRFAWCHDRPRLGRSVGHPALSGDVGSRRPRAPRGDGWPGVDAHPVFPHIALLRATGHLSRGQGLAIVARAAPASGSPPDARYARAQRAPSDRRPARPTRHPPGRSPGSPNAARPTRGAGGSASAGDTACATASRGVGEGGGRESTNARAPVSGRDRPRRRCLASARADAARARAPGRGRASHTDLAQPRVRKRERVRCRLPPIVWYDSRSVLQLTSSTRDEEPDASRNRRSSSLIDHDLRVYLKWLSTIKSATRNPWICPASSSVRKCCPA
jgi:hypothetical protein